MNAPGDHVALLQYTDPALSRMTNVPFDCISAYPCWLPPETDFQFKNMFIYMKQKETEIGYLVIFNGQYS